MRPAADAICRCLRGPTTRRRAVRPDVEPLPAVLGIDAALAAEVVAYGTDNVIKEIRIARGDPDRAWADAATVVTVPEVPII